MTSTKALLVQDFAAPVKAASAAAHAARAAFQATPTQVTLDALSAADAAFDQALAIGQANGYDLSDLLG